VARIIDPAVSAKCNQASGQGEPSGSGPQPVTFRYKKKIDPKTAAQFGLVAEELENVNPDLVARDKDGKPFSIRQRAP
jgi:hypothetical protein